jgi:hypothetical protein
MFHPTITQILTGASILILCIAPAVLREFLDHRKKRTATFCDYFGPEYERDMLQHSALSESEDWLADRPFRFAPFRLRDSKPNEQRTRVSHSTVRHSESKGSK